MPSCQPHAGLPKSQREVEYDWLHPHVSAGKDPMCQLQSCVLRTQKCTWVKKLMAGGKQNEKCLFLLFLEAVSVVTSRGSACAPAHSTTSAW